MVGSFTDCHIFVRCKLLLFGEVWQVFAIAGVCKYTNASSISKNWPKNRACSPQLIGKALKYKQPQNIFPIYIYISNAHFRLQSEENRRYTTSMMMILHRQIDDSHAS
jgi:hypothetical protein